MEYVHGESLAALLRTSRQTGKPAPLPVVIRVMCDALEGLHAAHVASLAGRCLNIVHRDVSPQNIMIGADGNTRVLDFGIAQAAMRSQVSGSGMIKGKLAYMSPEQIQNRAVDARTDIFAAGVVLWEALTGKRLFFTHDSRETVDLVMNKAISPPSAIARGLPVELDRVVLKALSRDPEQRFDSAHDFAEAVRKASSEGSRRAVSDWVSDVAKDSLSRRLDLLETLEASAIHAQAEAVMPIVTGSSPFHVPFSASPTNEGTGTQTTSTRGILAVASEPSRVARFGPWFAALGGIAAAGIAWTVATKRPMTPLQVRSPAKEVLVAAAVVGQASASSALVPPPPPQVDSLPLAAASEAPTKRAPVKSRAIGAVQARTPRAKACTPPYRIDASGVRRVKLECL